MDDLSAITQVDLSSQVSVLVAKKAMDSQREQGEALVDLIRQAMPPAPHDGRLDTYA